MGIYILINNIAFISIKKMWKRSRKY